jgi:hypothetical protein
MIRSAKAQLGMMLALAAMTTMGDSSLNGYAPSGGTPYTPPEPTPEQERDIAQRAKNQQQLHRFVIGGREVWARNKKDALKKAKSIAA